MGDKTVVKFPFDMSTFFFDCRPTKCKCTKEEEPRKVTELGCPNGGTPHCPKMKEPTFAGKDECICADGVAPKCEDTNEYLKCPDGADYDLKLGNPGAYLSQCTRP